MTSNSVCHEKLTFHLAYRKKKTLNLKSLTNHNGLGDWD